jgi:ubiquinone/menaquinone biosynthesis C-methylase UbiE
MRCNEFRLRAILHSLIHFSLSFTLALGFFVHTQELLAGESDEIAEVLNLQPGKSVADVGAGDGQWSEDLAWRVGETGRVFCTEVDTGMVKRLRQRFANAGIGNVVVVLGKEKDTGLPTACCDAILLRLVYHHLTEPDAVAADLRRALRPGGRVAVVDMLPQKHMSAPAGVPDRGGHGVHTDDVIKEMNRAGFRLVSRHDNWSGRSERFCLVFMQGPGAHSGR